MTKISKDPLQAAKVIQEGGIVIFPTETVFGIGASSYSEEACRRIYKIKNRPSDNPFIIHVASFWDIQKFAHIPKKYKDFIREFTPGPITFILKKKFPLFSTGLDTIGIRVPDHIGARRMLVHSGPVSAPSANFSGKPSITKMDYIMEEFISKVDLIYDSEEPQIGIESTVLELSEKKAVLLRPGKISAEEIRSFLGEIDIHPLNSDHSPKSPGLKYRHYSPEAKVVFIANMDNFPENVQAGYIGFRRPNQYAFEKHIEDNLDYMKELYSFFIECDKRKIQTVYCEYPLKNKYEMAILNRLEKAAGK